MLGSLVGAATKLVGGGVSYLQGQQQMKMQKQFAQKGLQWKAKDAEKAGISKYFAMGAPSAHYQPVSVGGVGASIADAGQDIGRAIDAPASAKGRAGTLATELAAAQLDGIRIENDIKRQELLSRMALRNQPGNPPAMPDSETTPAVPGQGNAKLKLEKKLAPAGYLPHKSFGVSPEVDMYRTLRGYSPEVPEQLGEAQESQPLAAAQWFIRNKLMPAISDAWRTYPYKAPEGSYWTFNPVLGEYVLKKKSDKFGNPEASWRYLMDRLRR